MKKRTVIIISLWVTNIAAIGYYAWFCSLLFGLWVNPPIAGTREQSIEILRNEIFNNVISNLTYGLLGVLLLSAINWTILKLIKQPKAGRAMLYIAFVNTAIVLAGSFSGFYGTEEKLTIEIDRYFQE